AGASNQVMAMDRADSRSTDGMSFEDRFRGVFESMPDAIVIVDGAGAIVFVNGQSEGLFGYSREELLGRSVESLIPERYRAAHVVHRAGFFASPASRPMSAGLELYALCKDGREVPVEISLSPLETDEGMLGC